MYTERNRDTLIQTRNKRTNNADKCAQRVEGVVILPCALYCILALYTVLILYMVHMMIKRYFNQCSR